MMTIRAINIEKLSKLKTFLLFLSFILFVDTTLILFTDITLRNITLDFFKKNMGNIIIILVLYTLYMSTIVKLITILFNQIILEIRIRFYSIFDINDLSPKNRYYNFTLRNIAIKHNNSVLYNHYKQAEKNEEEVEILKSTSISIIILFIVNYFISSEEQISLMQIYSIFLEHSESIWYFKLLNIFLLIIMMTIFSKIVIDDKNRYTTYLDKDIIDFINKNVENKDRLD